MLTSIDGLCRALTLLGGGDGRGVEGPMGVNSLCRDLSGKSLSAISIQDLHAKFL